ncbi:MAG: hypothetical protein Q7J31_09370 [Syntrophales bacterium]|nr:hypothetical protein [Syntrophales bacterium]
MLHKDKMGLIKGQSGAQVSEEITKAVRLKTVAGVITCADAGGIAGELNVTMREIGVALDLMGVHITKCQLGLFGYAPRKMIVLAAETVALELEEAIHDALFVDQYLSCAASWEIAERLCIPRMKVSSACQALKIKIKPCQLGAF